MTVIGTVLALVLLAVAPAVGDDVACGDVITADLTLTHDLGPCVGDGLIARASNIVIDLGGHTITGDGVGDDGGIRIEPFEEESFGNITVRRGTITGFEDGVVMAISGGNDVLQLELVGNTHGINLDGTSGSAIERNVVRDSAEVGIRVYGFSSGNTFRKNTLIGNVSGISVSAQSDDNIILQNDVVDGDFGISVLSDSDDNFMNRNTVRGMALDGIRIDDFSDNNEVVMNESTGNGDDGIDIDAPATEVTKNTADDNGDLGIEAVAGVIDGGGNEASGNGNPAQCTIFVQCE